MKKNIARGSRLPQTKLTDGNIAGIKLAVAEGWPLSMVAMIYGVSKAHISRIANEKRRKEQEQA